MRLRLGLFLGFAIGYVLGAKAGVQRYEQIQQLWSSVSRSEPAQQLGTEVRDVANRASDVLEQKAAEGVDKVTGLIGNKDQGNDELGRIPPA